MVCVGGVVGEVRMRRCWMGGRRTGQKSPVAPSEPGPCGGSLARPSASSGVGDALGTNGWSIVSE